MITWSLIQSQQLFNGSMKYTPLSPSIKPQKICLISPIGEFDDKFAEKIARCVSDTFKLESRIQSLLNSIDFAFDKKRNQYHSTAILDKLVLRHESEFDKVMALTSADLFIPILTHVYGEAQLGGKSCIVSTARLNEGLDPRMDKERFLGRVIKEALHELGHTFRLVHCKDPHCIMHYCRSIKDVDKKTNEMCRYCNVLLQDQLKKEEIPDLSSLSSNRLVKC